jgi:hypothetical protein
VIDPLVDSAGRLAAATARGVAWSDDQIVDGVVRQTSAAINAGGGAVRLTRGRVRLYVAIVLTCVAGGFASVALVVLLRG